MLPQIMDDFYTAGQKIEMAQRSDLKSGDEMVPPRSHLDMPLDKLPEPVRGFVPVRPEITYAGRASRHGRHGEGCMSGRQLNTQ
ncbi:MAG TPA: hypothetical protein VMX97_00075 [Hyphomicrobiaceae bacterium]|nr:hypothetical protein [Hyphomicrobiaceae bacterium]